MKLRDFLLGFGLAYSASALGADFVSADAMFAKRGTKGSDSANFRQASLAKVAYLRASAGTSGEDLEYAVSQMSRLDLYRGGMLKGHDEGERKDALRECVKNVEKIKGSGQKYFYFKSACMASLAKIAWLLERKDLAEQLRDIQVEALKSTKQSGSFVGGYEGGGILRIYAAIRGNKKAERFNLYDPAEGVVFAKVAKNSPAQENSPFESMSGEDYYENYYYLAFALCNLSIDKKDKSILGEAKDEISSAIEVYDELKSADELPKGRNAELTYYRGELEDLLNKVNACEDERKWYKCLNKKL